MRDICQFDDCAKNLLRVRGLRMYNQAPALGPWADPRKGSWR